jgi:hypothetical protein
MLIEFAMEQPQRFPEQAASEPLTPHGAILQENRDVQKVPAD